MLIPPLTFSDLSLLLAVGAIILLFVAELASPRYSLANFAISAKKLRNAAFAVSTFFLVTVVVAIVNIIIGF